MNETQGCENKEQIEELEKKIDNNLSFAQTFNKISIVISAVIYLIGLIPYWFKDVSEFFISETIAVVTAISLWILLYKPVEECNKSKENLNRYKRLDFYVKLNFFREFLFIISFIIMLGFDIFDKLYKDVGYSGSFGVVIGYSFNLLGRFLNIGVITIIIEKVFLGKVWYYLKGKHDLEMAPINERIRRQEIAEMRNQKASQLLNEVGKKFFVDNFEKLKNWYILDIVDELDNNSNQLERIRTGKKIFEEGLERIVLIKIINSEDSIDKTTIDKAKKLLEK